MPPYLLVLALGAAAGIVLMQQAPGAWSEAQAAGSFPAEVRRQVIFALLFNAGMGAALVAAAAGELLATVVRLVRKAPTGRTLFRLLVSFAVPAAFLAAHAVVNPWLRDLVRALRAAA